MRLVLSMAPAFAAAVSVFANCGTSAAAPTYSFADVVSPNGIRTAASGINGSGQVVGFFDTPYTPTSAREGFLFNPATGSYTTIMPPAAAIVAQSTGFTSITANGVNDAGQIVGSYSSGACMGYGCQASYLYDPTTQTYTSLADPAGGNTTALGIDNRGQIVGTFSLGGPQVGSSGAPKPFLRDPTTGAYSTFTVPAQGVGEVYFAGINNSGLIVGRYTTPTGFAMGFSFAGTDHSFTYDPVSGVFTALDDPLAAPGTTVGFMGTTGGTDAFGINDLGQVVGTYYDASGNTLGFLYDPASGTYTTLTNPALPGEHLELAGINDAGQISGFYSTFDRTFTNGSFIGTPTQVSASVPEPSSLALLGVFAGCSWFTRRRLECRL